MIILLIYPALLIFGYATAAYEIYDSEALKKKRVFKKKPLYFNKQNIIFSIIILTIFFLTYDYCSNNFDIDLKKEYENINEKDLLFGKKNLCQYALEKYVYDVLSFKYTYISYATYTVLTIILIILLYYLGIIERLLVYILDNLLKLFNINYFALNKGYFEMYNRLYQCKEPFMNSLLKLIFRN